MVITDYLLMPKVFKHTLANYSMYCDKVSELLTLRPDVTEDEIIDWATKQFNSTTMSMHSILNNFIFLAQHGENFPGENEK